MQTWASDPIQIRAKLNTDAERRAYALQGYCLCPKCEAIREDALTPPERSLAMLPAATISALVHTKLTARGEA